jgi:hypothetical protein
MQPMSTQPKNEGKEIKEINMRLLYCSGVFMVKNYEKKYDLRCHCGSCNLSLLKIKQF